MIIFCQKTHFAFLCLIQNYSMELKGIKNIIFDLGAVIINIDPERSRKSLDNISGGNYENDMKELVEGNFFEQYEKGEISTNDFVDTLAEALMQNASEAEIKKIWNMTLLDIPQARMDVLKRAKKDYNTFLLSNTNDLHIEAIYKMLEEEYNMPNLDSLFDKVYLSYEIGLRKPEPEIFQKVLNDNNLKAEETLFIDDREEHTLAAERLGIRVYHLTSEENLESLFDEN